MPLADMTATATLILAGITLGLAVATVALVKATRRGTGQARKDAAQQVAMMQRQIDAEHRPLLIEVLPSGPILPDMGARPNPNIAGHRQGEAPKTILLKYGQREGIEIDPRAVFVGLDGGSAYVSVPLRNVGRGLAVVDPESIEISGVALGTVKGQPTARRQRVPVGETTRIDLVAHYRVGEPIGEATDWLVRVSYRDFAGEQPACAKIHLRCPDGPQGPWYVVGVDQGLS